MSTQRETRVRERRAHGVVDALVGRGLVDPARRLEAVDVVHVALDQPEVEANPRGSRLPELLGYLGGALVISAAALFFALQWGDLTTRQQVLLLAAGAVALAVVAGVLVAAGGGFAAMRTQSQAARRRLAGVLFTGSAALAAAAVGAQLASATGEDTSTHVLVACLTMLVLAVAGYVAAPTVVGMLAAAVAAFATVGLVLDEFGDVQPAAYGALVAALGVAWVVLAETGVWHEVTSSRVVGCILVVAGAQIPVFDFEGGSPWIAYLMLAAVAVSGFWLYVARNAWPYLAAGVVSVTLVVPEALADWTDGSLGAAGGMLVAGVTLLVASLVGMRLRRGLAGEGS
jgi:hypothetical protein